ncbi:MAG: AI-2E family transporter [Actinomycetes bacterium]
MDSQAKVAKITGRTFTEFVTGKIIDAIVIGVLCTVSMLVFRIPYPALIGMLVGATNVIPFLGPFLGVGPG